MKGFVNPLITGAMIIITLYASTSDFVQNFGAKVYAQENDTLILDEMRAILRDQQSDISSIRNLSSAHLESSTQSSMSSTRLSIQGAYTSLSVFFIGIGLVVFGLRLTSRVAPQIGRAMTIMVWALTIPVLFLFAFFQYEVIVGNPPELFREDQPYLLLSFLMYIPTGIVLFLLLAQKRFIQAQAAQPAQGSNQAKKDDMFQELDRLASLKQQGLITEEEFQKLKTRLISSI